MRLSCSSPMVPAETITGKAELLRSWGFQGISIFLDYDAWNDAVRTEILHLEDRTGIVPCEFVLVGQLYGHLMDADASVRQRCRSMYSEAVELCATIGAVTELEFEYSPQSPLPLFEPYRQLSNEDRDAFADMYTQLLSGTNGSSGSLLIEPLNRYESRYLNTVDDSIDVLDMIPTGNSGLLFDFFHSSIEESDLAASIVRAGDRIRHVHLGDNNRLLPGYGNIDWASCLGALQQIGYNGFMNLECSVSGDPTETLPGAVEYLSNIFASF